MSTGGHEPGHFLYTGEWEHGAKWAFYDRDTLPDTSDPYTGAALVGIRALDPTYRLDEQEVVLTMCAEAQEGENTPEQVRLGLWEMIAGETDPLDPASPKGPKEHPWAAARHEGKALRAKSAQNNA